MSNVWLEQEAEVASLKRRISELEAEVEALRGALIKIRSWREIGSAVTPVEFLFAIEEIVDEALMQSGDAAGGSDG